MVCPFILATIQHEAETYHAQGLHQEALEVYNHFLVNAKGIKPALRSAIEAAKMRIDASVSADDQDENSRITTAEITRIKRSWAQNATPDDLAVSAKALMKLGRYSHALEEYRRLLIEGSRTGTAIRGITACLLRQISPENFVEAVTIFANGALKTSTNRITLKLLIAYQIDAHCHIEQFSRLYHHLTQINPVSDEIQHRIKVLGRRLEDANAALRLDDADGPMCDLYGVCHPMEP